MSESNSIIDQVTSEQGNNSFDASSFISSDSITNKESIEETDTQQVESQESAQAEKYRPTRNNSVRRS